MDNAEREAASLHSQCPVTTLRVDPYGMTDLFWRTLIQNLHTTDPRAATEQALATVKRHLDASEFIDLSHKGSASRAYMRVDKRPETHKRPKRGGVM